MHRASDDNTEHKNGLVDLVNDNLETLIANTDRNFKHLEVTELVVQGVFV